MNIVIFGPPGAGKGTQAENLVKEFYLIKISTGDLLREEVKKKNPIGDRIKTLIDKGSFVSDDIINILIENILSNKKYFNRLIFDGYPRNLFQAKNLDILNKKFNQKVSCVLNLKVKQDIAIKRVLGRQTCSNCSLIFNEFFNPATKKNHNCDYKFLKKRSDDNEKTIINRFKKYEELTLPILDYYQKQKLSYEINGMGDISSIYKEIRDIIRSLET